jgi:hypothetical protein
MVSISIRLPFPVCSVSWAGVFWVLLSELFSMSAKSPAVSAATATLFLTGKCAGWGAALFAGVQILWCRILARIPPMFGGLAAKSCLLNPHAMSSK